MKQQNKFNKHNTYVLGVRNNSWVSKKIQQLSPSKLIKQQERWSHVAILFFDFENNNWSVIESHVELKGVIQHTYRDWLQINTDKVIECIEFNNINLHKAKQLAKYRQPYGKRDIFWHWLWTRLKIANLVFLHQPDRAGIICSELIAKCDTLNFINYIFKLKDHEIKPNHFKEYAIIRNIPILKIKSPKTNN